MRLVYQRTIRAGAFGLGGKGVSDLPYPHGAEVAVLPPVRAQVADDPQRPAESSVKAERRRRGLDHDLFRSPGGTPSPQLDAKRPEQVRVPSVLFPQSQDRDVGGGRLPYLGFRPHAPARQGVPFPHHDLEASDHLRSHRYRQVPRAILAGAQLIPRLPRQFGGHPLEEPDQGIRLSAGRESDDSGSSVSFEQHLHAATPKSPRGIVEYTSYILK